jgi:hypothetical protein
MVRDRVNLAVPQKLPKNVEALFRVGSHELAHIRNVTYSHTTVRDDIVVLRGIQLESLRHCIKFQAAFNFGVSAGSSACGV